MIASIAGPYYRWNSLDFGNNSGWIWPNIGQYKLFIRSRYKASAPHHVRIRPGPTPIGTDSLNLVESSVENIAIAHAIVLPSRHTRTEPHNDPMGLLGPTMLPADSPMPRLSGQENDRQRPRVERSEMLLGHNVIILYRWI